MHRFARLVAFALAAFLVAGAVAVPADAAPPLDAAAANSLQERIDRTLEDRNWSEALPLINRYLAEVRRDPIMLYNAACCHAQLGDIDKGASTLLDAVKAGFREFDTMEADPDLEPLREHSTYTAILEARDRVREGKRRDSDPPDLTPASKGRTRGGAEGTPAGTRDGKPVIDLDGCPQCEEWKRLHGTKKYRYERDEARRFNYATCLDDETHREVRELIEREADWLAKHLFGGMPSYDTLVAVPTTSDSTKYLRDAANSGIYLHASRMLVARDVGESLQHELVHLMHYGQMERLRQKHPIWIQEGLAALFEAFDLDGEEVRFQPNTRHNIIFRAVKGGGAMEWRKLFAMSPDAFADRGSGLYPQVRSIFLYFADRGKLLPFYEEYTKRYRNDPTGAAAIERVFGKPLTDVERQWREWVKAAGAIDDTIRTGDASLGIQITETPTGLKINKTLPGSAVRAGGMRAGDVIVAIEGKPVRSSRELALAIASKRVGDTVLVRYRRRDDYGELPITLRPLQLNIETHTR